MFLRSSKSRQIWLHTQLAGRIFSLSSLGVQSGEELCFPKLVKNSGNFMQNKTQSGATGLPHLSKVPRSNVGQGLLCSRHSLP